eukprot:357383-Pleurochrysis_carterae.AAC.2
MQKRSSARARPFKLSPIAHVPLGMALASDPSTTCTYSPRPSLKQSPRGGGGGGAPRQGARSRACVSRAERDRREVRRTNCDEVRILSVESRRPGARARKEAAKAGCARLESKLENRLKSRREGSFKGRLKGGVRGRLRGRGKGKLAGNCV